MAPMPKVLTVSDLYPPTAPTDVEVVLSLMTGERDSDRRALLTRRLTDPERVVVRKHVADLEPYIARGNRTQKGQAILDMLKGLAGVTLSRDEASDLCVHYVTICDDLPLWAVRIACLRFAQGKVRPEEVGAEHLDPNWRPSTAQLYRVASNHATPILQMRFKLGEALRGSVALTKREYTPEEAEANRERVRAALQRFREGRVTSSDEEQEAQRLKAREIAARAAKVRDQSILAEYRERGLEPPPGYLVSLDLLLSMGWTITEVAGKPVLLSPETRKPAPGKTREQYAAEQAELNDQIPF